MPDRDDEQMRNHLSKQTRRKYHFNIGIILSSSRRLFTDKKNIFKVEIRVATNRLAMPLQQAWATSGPRATCGPPSTLMWPASYVWSFLTRYFYFENMLKICFIVKITLRSYFFWESRIQSLFFSLREHVLARGYLFCLLCGPRSQKSCPPLLYSNGLCFWSTNVGCLDQWFSTLGSWRPTKHNDTQFGDPYITIIVI